MAKNPVFPLYYNDIDRSTRDWTDEEFGAYVRLLVHQWDKGCLPNDYQRLTRIATSLDTNWGMLKSKFPENGVGLKNPVLEEIRSKILRHKEKQKNNVLKRYQNNTTDVTKNIPLEDEREKENILEEIGGEKTSDIANEVWKDQYWKESICSGLNLNMEELKKWLSLFNSSISSEKIENFNKSSYKKMSRGWIVKQQAKGVKVETNILRKSESAPLTKLTHHGV